MSDFQDSFNDNNGMLNAMGNMAAINQRNRLIAEQKEQASAIREQTAALEKRNSIEAAAREKSNRVEGDRATMESQRLKIEKQRLRAEEAERELRKQQAEQLKQLRNLMADSFATLERLEKLRPAN